MAAAGAAAGGLGPAGASIGSAMSALEVCKKGTPGEGGASWQQQCAEDMDARFGDGNDSDVKHQRSFLDPSHRQQRTMSSWGKGALPLSQSIRTARVTSGMMCVPDEKRSIACGGQPHCTRTAASLVCYHRDSSIHITHLQRDGTCGCQRQADRMHDMKV